MLSRTRPHRALTRTQKCALATSFVIVLGACGGSSEATSANAGTDGSVVAGVAPEFDGCESTGDIVNFQWQIVETPADNVDDVGKFLREESTDCAFTLENVMQVDEVGVWTIELTVEDADGAVETDTVEITVTDS